MNVATPKKAAIISTAPKRTAVADEVLGDEVAEDAEAELVPLDDEVPLVEEDAPVLDVPFPAE